MSNIQHVVHRVVVATAAVTCGVCLALLSYSGVKAYMHYRNVTAPNIENLKQHSCDVSGRFNEERILCAVFMSDPGAFDHGCFMQEVYAGV